MLRLGTNRDKPCYTKLEHTLRSNELRSLEKIALRRLEDATDENVQLATELFDLVTDYTTSFYWGQTEFPGDQEEEERLAGTKDKQAFLLAPECERQKVNSQIQDHKPTRML